jgi:hypothetical protein
MFNILQEKISLLAEGCGHMRGKDEFEKEQKMYFGGGMYFIKLVNAGIWCCQLTDSLWFNYFKNVCIIK